MKAKVLAEGTDIEPDQLLTQAEDDLNMELALNEVEKAKNILNNTDNWLTSHPLEVCIGCVNKTKLQLQFKGQ